MKHQQRDREMKKEAGGANEGDEAVDNKAADVMCVAELIGEHQELDFFLYCAGDYDCAVCKTIVLSGGGLRIWCLEGPDPKRVLRLHHRCAGMLSGAIELRYLELGDRARQEINEAEARMGLGHA
jgi:hypothetical protein